jgi:hypothetical protein
MKEWRSATEASVVGVQPHDVREFAAPPETSHETSCPQPAGDLDAVAAGLVDLEAAGLLDRMLVPTGLDRDAVLRKKSVFPRFEGAS